MPRETRPIIKTPKQIEGITKSCRLTVATLDMVAERIGPGITTDTINMWVHEFIVEHGAVPAPLNYRGFPKSVCTSVNDVILHGIPGQRVLEDGDIVNVDVTTILGGYYGDASRMYFIGSPSDEARRIVNVTHECLELGIQQVRPGAHLGDIGHVIQQHAETNGYSVVRDFCGHGTGVEFHEPPDVLHFGKRGKGMLLRKGMTFTIEPMVNGGSYAYHTLADGWTTITADGALSAQWEHTVLVTDDGVAVLTQ